MKDGHNHWTVIDCLSPVFNVVVFFLSGFVLSDPSAICCITNVKCIGPVLEAISPPDLNDESI